MRIAAAALAALSLVACGAGTRAAEPDLSAVRIAAQPIPLDASHPDKVRVGDFRYAGGLVLTSPDTSRFGGLSDLQLAPDGGMIAVSDEGDLLRARLLLDADGRPTGLDQASIRGLKDLDGQPVQGKTEADAEGLMVWPGGEVMVSFERDHRIWLYPADGGPPRKAPSPEVTMPLNEGMEAVAPAPSKGPDAYWVGLEGGSIWLCRLPAACERWAGLPAPSFGWRLTALAETPSGELVILHHSFNPLTLASSAQVSVVTIPATPNGKSKRTAKLKLAAPMAVDNFEGVAVAQAPGGGLRLYLLSDDNFSQRQRTLLFAFDQIGAKPPKRAAAH